MKVIVAGSVNWINRESIRVELESLPNGSVVIHGDAEGADEIAGEVARELGLSVEPMAKIADDYRRYKRGAWKGLNERMVNANVELILAFHPDIHKSRGTKHLLKLADEKQILYRIIER